MKRIVAVFAVASMSFAAASVAQEVADAAWGLRFVPPPGWSQQPSPEGYLYLAPDGQRLLAVLPHEAASVEALRAEAQRGLHDGYGTVLLLHGALERFGNRGLAGDFEGRIEGSPARARVIGLVAPSGPGATVLAAAAPQAYSAELAEVAADVARSVAFDASHRAESSGNSTSGVASDEAEEWTDWLEGCRLSYFNSYDSGYGGGGYIDETVIDLCPGYFTYGAHSETVFNTPDLSGGDVALQSSARGAGQWEVLDIGGQLTLRLTYHDGSTRSYALSYEDGKTFLDGSRWLRTCDPNDTVVEARPQCR